MAIVVALAFGLVAFGVGVRVGWNKRRSIVDDTLAQAIDDVMAARADAARWHAKALEGPRWQEQARLAHKLEQYEHLLHCNGIKVDV